jgi:hypothetical protein
MATNSNDPLSVKAYTKTVQTGEKKTPVYGGNFGSFTSNLVTDYNYKPIYGKVQDTGRSVGDVAMNYQRLGNQSILDMIAAAQGGVGAVNGGGIDASVQGGISTMNQYADQARASAASMGGSISGLKSSANNLSPYANMLRQYGSTIFNQGSDLYKSSPAFLQSSADILGMNRNAGGATGSYIDSLMAIDPNQYVGSAASDVQGSFQNALGQMQRNLGRSGIDSASARSQTLNSDWARALASAQAGAKTRARQTGLQERLAAMRDSLSVAGGMAGTGASIAGQAAQQQATGAGVVQSGAGVEAQRGGMLGQAGQLQATQANAYTNAGQLTQGSSNLALGLANSRINAQAQLAQAQQVAAQYYSQTASGWGQLAGSGNVISALFS